MLIDFRGVEDLLGQEQQEVVLSLSGIASWLIDMLLLEMPFFLRSFISRTARGNLAFGISFVSVVMLLAAYPRPLRCVNSFKRSPCDPFLFGF